MKTKVIVNPYSDRWRAKERVPEVEKALRGVRLDYDLVITTAPEEGIQLAQAAVTEGYEAVIAAGGDGTINEVINGILMATGEGATLPFGILPLGTANDFYQMAGLPASVEGAVRVIAQGETRQVDAGQVNDRFFINNSAAAMEPMVTLENIRMKRLSGEIRYVVALIKAIAKIKAWQMRVVWDGGHFDGPVYLLSVCNSPRTGGFTMAPGASINDGLFDLVLAPEVPRRTLLLLLLKLMKGTHVYHEAVTFAKTRKLSFISQPGTPVHSDGEVFTESATEVEYKVLPAKVSLLSAP
ncbi:MAG: diacylglycerol kinase family lipid kinase [Candidatus Promineifilaceae bacterium]|nr:diacylglycerol kinase family lipid kinase [Candidatus Promineifilaceae bacterium]